MVLIRISIKKCLRFKAVLAKSAALLTLAVVVLNSVLITIIKPELFEVYFVTIAMLALLVSKIILRTLKQLSLILQPTLINYV